jgi:hypothetical protein
MRRALPSTRSRLRTCSCGQASHARPAREIGQKKSPAQLTTFLSSGEHLGYRLRSPGKNSESVEAEEETS